MKKIFDGVKVKRLGWVQKNILVQLNGTTAEQCLIHKKETEKRLKQSILYNTRIKNQIPLIIESQQSAAPGKLLATLLIFR